MAEALAPSIAPDTDPREEHLLEIIGHLGVALMQVAPEDDQIVVGHIRSAYDHAISLCRAIGWQPAPAEAL